MKRARKPLPYTRRHTAIEQRFLVTELEFFLHRVRRAKLPMTTEILETAVTQIQWEVAHLQAERPTPRAVPTVEQAMRLEVHPVD